MARKPRLLLPGVPQHIVQRGNNRNPCFFADSDYLRYLEDLQTAASENDVSIHAYVLMSNHVHLLATPRGEWGITHMMQDVGRKFVQFINRSYLRSGTLWEGRFRACLVESEAYLLTCMRYIELNPVRARMVEHPEAYRWSSYTANAGGPSDNLVRAHECYRALGLTNAARAAAYRELFRYQLEEARIKIIRTALNSGLVLGNERFKDDVERVLKRRVRPGKAGRPCQEGR